MCTDIYATNNENMSENGWTLLRYIEKCTAIVKDRCCAHWHVRYHLGGRHCTCSACSACSACSQLHKISTHAQYDRFHTSVKKQQSFHTRECTTARLHAKNYASIRFCRRSGPTTKFLNVCENFARNVGHYCPFTRSSFCNISQTLRRNVGCFRRVKMALHSYGAPFVK